MEITVKELAELSEYIVNNQNIRIEPPETLTIKAKTRKDSEVLIRSIEIEIGNTGKGITIDKLGVYNCDGMRIWVVKD